MRQISLVIVTRLGTHFLHEQLSYLFLLDMDGRHDDMARMQMHQLQDTFAQIAFHYLYPLLF